MMIQPDPPARMTISSPAGDLTIFEQTGAIVRVAWGQGGPGNDADTSSDLLTAAAAWLRNYFAGSAAPFDLPMAPQCTGFQRRAWRVMEQIPSAETLTYGDVANQLGSAPRAVGGACRANPIPILIPCHRIVATGGGLGGYSGAGGLTTKRALLELEARTGASLSRAA